MYSYLSLDALRLRLDIGDAVDDTTLRQELEAASRKVDDLCGGRRFQPYQATRRYTATETSELEVDDLLSVDEMQVSGAVYTEYELEPYNAPFDREPYTTVVGSFPLERRAVQISGRWGYCQELETAGATLGANLSDSATTVTVSSGPAFQRLQTILIDDEAMYVTRIVDNVLTVVRGQHGTVAASHSSGEVIHIYRYPAPIVEATALLAARLFRRTDAPLGVAGTDAMGTATRIATRESDALLMVANYRRMRGAAVRG